MRLRADRLPHKLHYLKRGAPPVGVLSSADAACLVVAPIRHDADRSTAAARANEAATLGNRRERRSIFDARRREGHERRVKAIGVRARHAEGAYAHRFQVRDSRRRRSGGLLD